MFALLIIHRKADVVDALEYVGSLKDVQQHIRVPDGMQLRMFVHWRGELINAVGLTGKVNNPIVLVEGMNDGRSGTVFGIMVGYFDVEFRIVPAEAGDARRIGFNLTTTE